MTTDYWQKQLSNAPLYNDLIWSQPQHTAQAGRLLIIGGNIHGFSAPAKAYGESQQAGIGSVKVLMPDVLRKTIGKVLPDADYAPSTPSGSLANSALTEAIHHASSSDATLLAGDIGRNSETAMFHEAFCGHYKGLLSISRDALDVFTPNPTNLLARPNTLIIATLAQLQKITIKCFPDIVITAGMSLLQLVEAMHLMTERSRAVFITKHAGNILVANKGQISSTKVNHDPLSWIVAISTYASVWWLQNPNQPLEAMSSAIYLYFQHNSIS